MLRPMILAGALLALAAPALAQDASNIENELKVIIDGLRTRVERSKQAAHIQAMNDKLAAFLTKWEPRAAEGRNRLPLAQAHMYRAMLARGDTDKQQAAIKTAKEQVELFLQANPGDKSGEALKTNLERASQQLARVELQKKARAEAEAKRDKLIGKPAIELEIDEVLDPVEGQDLHLASLSGKVVILDFWATWCGPCRVTIPHIIKLKEKYGDKLVILGMTRFYTYGFVPSKEPGKRGQSKRNLDPEAEREVNRQCVAAMGINYPIVFSKAAGKAYHVTGIPQMVIVDKKGVVRKIHVGSRGLEAVDKVIEECLAESGS